MINIKPETALEEITHYEAEKKQKCKEEPSLKVIFFAVSVRKNQSIFIVATNQKALS